MKLSTESLLLRLAPLGALGLLAGLSLPDSKSGLESAALGEPAAHLDIKPGSCPNPVNVNHPDDAPQLIDGRLVSVVPMSLLGNKFNVTQVNIGTIFLSRGDADGGEVVYPIQSNFDDTGTPFEGQPCGCHALTGDGELDLDFKFDKEELVAIFELQAEPHGSVIELDLNGSLKDGKGFRARDCIRIINQ